MNKLLISLALVFASLQGVEIPTQEAHKKVFTKSIALNAQIVQLSNASQSLMSLVNGKISRYYVKEGQRITKGQKLVSINSIALSRMTATYIAQKKQLKSLQNNYDSVQYLYKKGMASRQELNAQVIKKDELLATLSTLKSQLMTLGINPKSLRKANSSFTLYAHDDGVVSKILKPLHSGVQADMPILSLIKEQAYYIKSYVPLKFASKLRLSQKVSLEVNGKTITSHITQILPELDTQSQRVVVLSSINEKIEGLFINTYVEVKLYLGEEKEYVAVKKSALSFFNNEWVIFIPKEEEHLGEAHEDEHGHEDEHEKEDEHAGHGHEEETHNEHGNDAHEEEGHDEHEEEEAAYEIRVVKIIMEDDVDAAVEGIQEHEEYASDKSYYVKSMLLKSALGGHGH